MVTLAYINAPTLGYLCLANTPRIWQEIFRHSIDYNFNVEQTFNLYRCLTGSILTNAIFEQY